MSNLSIIFQYQGNAIPVQCRSTDKLKDVYVKFSNKVQKNVNDFKFYLNSMEVPPCEKNLEQLRVGNFHQFNAVENNVLGAWFKKAIEKNKINNDE